MHRIAVMMFDGVRGLDVTGPLAVFEAARADYRTVLHAVTDAEQVRCAEGVSIGVRPLRDLTGRVDTLLVPGGGDRPPAELVAALGAHAGRAGRVAAVSTGAFALAAAGLLDGRRATTHWRDLDAFADRYPRVLLDRETVHARDGRFWTSAGAAAGLDLALALVTEDHGAAVAHEIGRELVVLSRRLDGHPQLSVSARTPRPRHGGLDRLLQTIAARPAEPYTMEKVARELGLSPRHLARVFQEQVGCSLRAYVRSVRLEAALALVLAGESFHAAASRTGLRSGAEVRDFLREDRRARRAALTG
jgi:transcriptional regulator GlxA family with amidase domain